VDGMLGARLCRTARSSVLPRTSTSLMLGPWAPNHERASTARRCACPMNGLRRPAERPISSPAGVEQAHDGVSTQDAAELLCRSGTVEDVTQKARELGLRPAEPMTVYAARNNDTP